MEIAGLVGEGTIAMPAEGAAEAGLRPGPGVAERAAAHTSPWMLVGGLGHEQRVSPRCFQFGAPGRASTRRQPPGRGNLETVRRPGTDLAAILWSDVGSIRHQPSGAIGSIPRRGPRAVLSGGRRPPRPSAEIEGRGGGQFTAGAGARRLQGTSKPGSGIWGGGHGG